MLALDDARWQTLKGGCHDIYDASDTLRALLNGEATEPLWEELWDALHHQGDVDTASYAAVPHLLEYARRSPKLDWNVFGLISAVELERPHNPPVPEDIAADYFQTIASIPEVVGSHPDQEWDEVLTQCIVACIALARRQRTLARVYAEMDADAAKLWLVENVGYGGWEAEADT